jgi:hypothetical protein
MKISQLIVAKIILSEMLVFRDDFAELKRTTLILSNFLIFILFLFFAAPLANLLMSQLMSQQNLSNSQRLLGAFGGNLELYPIFNPSLHMPILALAPGQMGGRTMSRAAYAKLQSANFPPILDRFGKQAEVIDGNSYAQFDMKQEESDMLSCNQIIFQFLAYSVNLESLREGGRSDSKPANVFFTFQFYRFPEFKTPK